MNIKGLPKEAVISIPSGAIKRAMVYYFISLRGISIPSGAIKSQFRLVEVVYFSAFQFLLVRLRGYFLSKS